MDDKEYLKKIGIKLKVLRSLKGLSQDDVANQLDVDKSYYSKIERGLTNPSILYLRHISNLYAITLSELVDSNISF
ncbi:probable transcriptional regulator [Clostridium sp. CAG:768]|jgi:transcriptional regulator with XRE-family HTH domain|uniref:helix-turn-helix domain-containing protein n=1 Tax=Candidatus Stercorousia sp. TaxID=3048886 RepID=UPI00033E363B|nr:probable transcriptional regulator [Clostridium sp. CAG:768]